MHRTIKDEVGPSSWESWPVSSRMAIERLERQLEASQARVVSLGEALEGLLREVEMHLRHPMAHNELPFVMGRARRVLAGTASER